MNSENNVDTKLDEEITARVQPFLNKIKALEDSVASKEEDIIILKYAYNKILSDVENLNKIAKKK